MDTLINRRAALKATVAVPVAATVAGCDLLSGGGGLSPLILVGIINGVQQAIATVCAISGAVVPTSESIFALVNKMIAAAGGKQIAMPDVINTVVAQIRTTL